MLSLVTVESVHTLEVLKPMTCKASIEVARELSNIGL